MAMGIVAAPQCAACGSPATRVELVAPGQVPAEWEQWKAERRQAFEKYRDQGRWRLLFEGIAAGNGWVGDAIEAARAERIEAAFQEPYAYAQLHTAGFYDDAGFCERCDAAYCHLHWQVSEIGYGHCRRATARALTLIGEPSARGVTRVEQVLPIWCPEVSAHGGLVAVIVGAPP
jgi:hypothetical protein